MTESEFQELLKRASEPTPEQTAESWEQARLAQRAAERSVQAKDPR